MKKTFLASLKIIALAITTTTNAQVGIGVSTANINPSAQLDVSSTTKGFLPPRMTEVQKNAISSPASGLLVYQTDGVSGYYYFDGAVWKSGLGPQGPTGPAGLSATSTMAEASTTGSSGTYLLNPSPNNVYINAGSWISIGANNTSSYYYVISKGNDNSINIINIGGALAAWPVNATVALVGSIGAVGVTGPAGPLVATTMASSGSLSFFGSSGTFALTPSANNVYINAGSYISIGTNNTSQYFYVSNKLDNNTITIVKTTMDAGFSWPVNATVALVGPTGPYGPQGVAGNDGSDATISIGAIGTATTNGATITSGVLSLAPADESHGGIITNGTQTFGGVKTFNNTIVANATVGVGTNTPSASAKLEVSSTTQGFLPPRMTEAQRNLISVTSASAGLTIWCTNCGVKGELEVYNGESWTNTMGGATAIIPYVTIGTQEWTIQNLNVSTYRNGDPIPKVTDNVTWSSLTTGAYCYYNNDSATYATTYGKLYNWYAVHDVRGLAPTGYHIPTDEEWTTLTTTLGADAGPKMKSTSGWNNNGNGTNSSGFAGLPGGFIYSGGTFFDIGSIGRWWSSTEKDPGYSWFRLLYSNSSVIGRDNFFKANGFSVRCIKD